MTALTSNREFPELRGGSVIPISATLRETLAMGSKSEYILLFENLRLDLQSRVSTLEDRELIKLQGKLDYLNELEQFFLSLLK